MTRHPLQRYRASQRYSALQRYRGDCSGAAALELAFALPILLALLMGGLWAGLLGFAVTSLNFSVQSAARCAAVNAQACGSTSAVQAFAAARYSGPQIPISYSVTTDSCGRAVTARAVFNLAILPGFTDLPLVASACYPANA